jgi:hypothetical protein
MTMAVGDHDDHPAILQRGGRDGVLVGDARHAVGRAALGGGDGLPSARAARRGLPGLARGQPGTWCGHLGHRIEPATMKCSGRRATPPPGIRVSVIGRRPSRCRRGSGCRGRSASRAPRADAPHAVSATRPPPLVAHTLPDGACPVWPATRGDGGRACAGTRPALGAGPDRVSAPIPRRDSPFTFRVFRRLPWSGHHHQHPPHRH